MQVAFIRVVMVTVIGPTVSHTFRTPADYLSHMLTTPKLSPPAAASRRPHTALFADGYV